MIKRCQNAVELQTVHIWIDIKLVIHTVNELKTWGKTWIGMKGLKKSYCEEANSFSKSFLKL